MKTFYFLLLIFLVTACTPSIEAHKELTNAEYQDLLIKIAPYVVKKPDGISSEQRFDAETEPFYKNFIELTKAELQYHQKKDTANFFSFNYRDLTSLKEHYRSLGGYYCMDNDSIVFVNLLYHTPRLTKEELQQKGEILFKSMIEKGNVDRFVGGKGFVDTPNEDFYYNTKLNRWDYTTNSSWKFLDSARKEVINDSIR